MIPHLLAVWLSVSETVPPPVKMENAVRLSIDPCVEIDETLVKQLVQLELHGARTEGGLHADSISVGCTDEGQEIRGEPWAMVVPEGIRAIQLPHLEKDADGVAYQTRSRELALAIAEFIRRLEMVSLPAAPAKNPPPAPPPTIVPPSERTMLGGVLPSFERFADGYTLMGGDLFAIYRPGRWFFSGVRIGARTKTEESVPLGHLHTLAGTVGISVGISLLPPRHPLGIALRLESQGFLVHLRTDGILYSKNTTLPTLTLTGGPLFSYRLSSRLSLTASVHAGAPIHGILVRLQGAEIASMSGFVVSGTFGIGVTF